MIAKDLYIVNKGVNDFRPNEPALIIGYKLVKPSDNLDYRSCFEVKYSDGIIDYIIADKDSSFYTLDDIANGEHLKSNKVVVEVDKTIQEHIEDIDIKWKQFIYSHPSLFKNSCLHDTCTSCNGTGRRADGSMCVHMISCNCSKCNPFTVMFEGATKW